MPYKYKGKEYINKVYFCTSFFFSMVSLKNDLKMKNRMFNLFFFLLVGQTQELLTDTIENISFPKCMYLSEFVINNS